MAHSFDPYHQWLGISPKDQPPNHYRLLGVDLFESDLDVISNAADQRMAHVRSVARPRPAQRIAHHGRTHRVQLDVAHQLEQIEEPRSAPPAILEPRGARRLHQGLDDLRAQSLRRFRAALELQGDRL